MQHTTWWSPQNRHFSGEESAFFRGRICIFRGRLCIFYRRIFHCNVKRTLLWASVRLQHSSFLTMNYSFLMQSSLVLRTAAGTCNRQSTIFSPSSSARNPSCKTSCTSRVQVVYKSCKNRTGASPTCTTAAPSCKVHHFHNLSLLTQNCMFNTNFITFNHRSCAEYLFGAGTCRIHHFQHNDPRF